MCCLFLCFSFCLSVVFSLRVEVNTALEEERRRQEEKRSSARSVLVDRLRDLELVSSSPFKKSPNQREVMTPPPAMKCDWPDCEWDTSQGGVCNSYADQRVALDLHLRMNHERRESEQAVKTLKGLKCEWEGCVWDTGDTYTSLSDQMSVMDLHIRVKHEGQRNTESKSVKVDPRMASKLDRPEILEETDEGDWAHFLFRWTQYKGGCSLDGDQVVYHLYSCMEASVSKKVHQNTQGAKLTEMELLEMVKDMVVKKKNEIVLHEAHQGDTSSIFNGIFHSGQFELRHFSKGPILDLGAS